MEPLPGEVMTRLGAVLSRLILACQLAELPALSIAVPLTTRAAPSVATVTGREQEATPLVLSEQVNVTVTLALFQPAAFAGGAALAMIVGGVLSTPFICSIRLSP